MATTSLKRHCCISFEASLCEIQTDSWSVSSHQQFPLCTNAFPDLVMDFPVSIETIETKSLSHPFGTCTSKSFLQIIESKKMKLELE